MAPKRQLTLAEAMKEIGRLRRILRQYNPEAVLQPNRARHKEIQDLVLVYASGRVSFTVDDLIAGPLPHKKRGTLAANLLHMSQRGLIKRVRKGKKGRKRNPAVYAARDRR